MSEPTNSTSDTKVEVIRRKYEALGRGDIQAILADVAEDVEWISVSEAPGRTVPWYGRYAGRSEVPRFFGAIGTNVDVTELTPLSFTSNETDVMVAIRWTFTVKATGKSVTAHMQHWWRFADRMITSVRTCEDSELTAAAFSE